ncbi:hypothetical protein JKP11_21835 [Vibrio vulnificus]|uniref:hypothetical protein n=1 Tax=Vibrio vulnificus TaxID=672 RepID=UPI001A1A5844|nr:hypothetical protein [Vibrio vulnificus]EHH0850222.1 hypothetical protein [Vibrio vulnificus]EHZ2656988.1 hypothetical protein [Vibrio vulnificus]MCA3958276.1 hypothetical protein [Vibrio vulnificus]HAS8524375.1 hypothetical protein [Vibrio vulnificus]
MDAIVKKVNSLIDGIAEYLENETAYTVTRNPRSDSHESTTEIIVLNGRNVLASINAVICMTPTDGVYAQIEFHPQPENIFRNKSISKLCKSEDEEYYFLELDHFSNQVLSGLEKSKDYWVSFHR